MRHERRKKGQRGAAVVEFAVIAPLLLVLVFGIIEFSILLFDKAMITNASREGARVGIVYRGPDTPRPSNAEIEQVVESYCEEHLISFDPAAELVIGIDPNDVASRTEGVSLTVTVTYPFRFLVFSNLLGLVGGGLADVLTLNAVTVMRME